MPNDTDLTECQIHELLANPRRRAVIEHFDRTAGTVGMRDLSEAVAVGETGQCPAPVRARESVYTALHQTHLPRLEEVGILRYDRDRSEVTMLDGSRSVAPYMNVVVVAGVTWGEYYRTLGVVGLTLVVASLAGAPVVSAVDPLLVASAALAVFAISSALQLWEARYRVRRLLPDVGAAPEPRRADDREPGADG